jgi:hypothetical protein
LHNPGLQGDAGAASFHIPSKVSQTLIGSGDDKSSGSKNLNQLPIERHGNQATKI